VKQAAQSELAELHLHDIAEKMAIGRKAIASGYGMEHKDRPWKSVTQTTAPAGGGIGSFLAGTALAILLGAGGVGVGAGATYLMMRHLAPTRDAEIEPAEYEIDVRLKDGKLVPSNLRKTQPLPASRQ
jgi:hypothetical protein